MPVTVHPMLMKVKFLYFITKRSDVKTTVLCLLILNSVTSPYWPHCWCTYCIRWVVLISEDVHCQHSKQKQNTKGNHLTHCQKQVHLLPHVPLFNQSETVIRDPYKLLSAFQLPWESHHSVTVYIAKFPSIARSNCGRLHWLFTSASPGFECLSWHPNINGLLSTAASICCR